MGAVGSSMLRANPGYELVMLDRLTAFERELLESELELYGVPKGKKLAKP